MLHDSLTVEEVVDSESALEFMKERRKQLVGDKIEEQRGRQEDTSKLKKQEQNKKQEIL